MLPKFSVAVATLLSVAGGVQALISSSDIPSDTPISSLLNSANVHLAKGETNDALTYYDIAISRDPASYLTYFKRGATYLSLGKTAQATQDFDKVLEIKPGFEGALLQRAKIKAKNGEFDAARKDYLATSNPPEQELIELSEAQGAAALATDAEKSRNWEECVTQSGVAIMVASRMLSLRQTRAHCRFERGEVEEGMSDLKHVLQMQPGRTEPHMQISSITFYGLGDMAQGMDQIRKCLHSDPDSKSCKKLYRQEKRIDKLFSQVSKNMERKSYASAVKILLPSGEDVGLVQEIKEDVQTLREAGTIPSSSQGSIPTELIFRAVEMVCEAYSEMKNTKKATQWCGEALTYNEHSLHGLLSKARKHMETEDFEAAIRVLNEAKEHHPGAQQIGGMMNNAQIELKRSKTKDYYKVLGLPRDADERQIRAAYRRMVKIHHPDKAHQQGITKEEAEKKMGAVNEAYEVLNDPELKARFDRGDDPNDHEQQRQHPFQQGGNPFAGHPFQQSGGGGQQFNFKFAQGGFNFG